MAPRQAHSLDVLLAEVNQHAPHRSKDSDGGLASPEHHAQNPGSDHEPNAAGVWRARDFTNDARGGLPGQELADLLAGLLGKHPAMMSGAYVIFNRRILSYNRLREGWRPYTEGDPHTGHVHLSVSTAAAGYDSRKAWNLWPKATPDLDLAIHYTQSARWKRRRGSFGWIQLGAALRILRAVRDVARKA